MKHKSSYKQVILGGKKPWNSLSHITSTRAPFVQDAHSTISLAAPRGPDTWSHIILDISVGQFLEEINISPGGRWVEWFILQSVVGRA